MVDCIFLFETDSLDAVDTGDADDRQVHVLLGLRLLLVDRSRLKSRD